MCTPDNRLYYYAIHHRRRFFNIMAPYARSILLYFLQYCINKTSMNSSIPKLDRLMKYNLTDWLILGLINIGSDV